MLAIKLQAPKSLILQHLRAWGGGGRHLLARTLGFGAHSCQPECLAHDDISPKLCPCLGFWKLSQAFLRPRAEGTELIAPLSRGAPPFLTCPLVSAVPEQDPRHPTLLVPGSSLGPCVSRPGSQNLLVSVSLSEFIPEALESQEDVASPGGKRENARGQEMPPPLPPILRFCVSAFSVHLCSPPPPLLPSTSIPVSRSGPLGVP